MFFGMFGSIFLLAQFFQTVQGYSPLGSGLRILPWTAMPMFVAPIAGALSDRIGGAQADGHRAGAAGGRARVDRGGLDRRRRRTPSSSCRSCISGIGMALFFAPVANVVLSARAAARRRARRRARNNAIRELGGVFGVAVLASVFAHYGELRSGQSFVDGMVPAVWIGAAVVAAGAVGRVPDPEPSAAAGGRAARAAFERRVASRPRRPCRAP